jgi:hypothetical protein
MKAIASAMILEIFQKYFRSARLSERIADILERFPLKCGLAILLKELIQSGTDINVCLPTS